MKIKKWNVIIFGKIDCSNMIASICMLPSACSHMHAPARMLPSKDKYIICYQIIKQIINPLFTIPCKLKKSNIIIFFSKMIAPVCMLQYSCPSPFLSYHFIDKFLSACSSTHSPVYMLLSLDKYIIH